MLQVMYMNIGLASAVLHVSTTMLDDDDSQHTVTVSLYRRHEWSIYAPEWVSDYQQRLTYVAQGIERCYARCCTLVRVDFRASV